MHLDTGNYNPSGLGFPPFRHKSPPSYRADFPDEHDENLKRVYKHSARQLNKRKGLFFNRRLRFPETVTDLQIQSIRHSFADQVPYLAPENIIPPETTLDSLLAKKVRVGQVVRYGKLSISTDTVELFEKLQRELGMIDQGRAVRQLYQLMNGHLPTNILFSELGHSLGISNFFGTNLVNINPNYGVLDPASGAIGPLSIVLAHEIEHINIPEVFNSALAKDTDECFSNAEELRVIDGCDNGYLKKLGRGERTTHSSFSVPLDPSDGKSIVFPYKVDGLQRYLRGGETLRGKIVFANDQTVTIEQSDQTMAVLNTSVLISSIHGLQHLRRLGFADTRPYLEKIYEYYRSTRTARKKVEREPLDLQHLVIRYLELQCMESDAMRKQIAHWQTAAQRGDHMVLSVNPNGIINLQRFSNDSDALSKIILKNQKQRQSELRKRCLLALCLLKKNDRKHGATPADQP